MVAISITLVTKMHGKMKSPGNRVDRKDMGTENEIWVDLAFHEVELTRVSTPVCLEGKCVFSLLWLRA